VEAPLSQAAMPELAARLEGLAAEGRAGLLQQGADPARIAAALRLHLRYAGTDSFLPVPFGPHDAVLAAFTAAHRGRFGFATPEREVVVEAAIAEVTAAGEAVEEAQLAARPADQAVAPIDRVPLWTAAAAHDAPVFDREALLAGDRIAGPALIREANATTVVEPGWSAEVTGLNHLILRRVTPRAASRVAPGGKPDPVMLELFNNLFMSIAEQTGAVLQNTSLSVNIKERLDFSCAIFDAGGGLVANAPHVPVHLGAMGESVRTVLRLRGASLRPGDVVALNNPYNGGTHLPDITVITPVFDEAGARILFFLGSRGHHADVGGLTPGSTPPDSRTLEEEGVIIDNFLLVEQGRFREAEFRALLGGARYPARSPDVNVADIKAQVAANEKGVQELRRAVADHGLATVQAYMGHVMDNAEESVRRVLDRLADGAFATTLDDGTPLRVAVRVDRTARRAVIDFSGTGAQRPGNYNAPAAVCRAVVLYCFRALVAEEIPLNDGCLKPLEIIVPEGSFLSPRPGAAVVAGNTEISQVTCNALLAALGACASAQATMNNVLFGDATYQYYETVCGGVGAGPLPDGGGFAGWGPVQTHMTNTRMTDPEILELRYPVRLEEFAIRRGTGGAGQWRGGDGARRRIRFLRPMQAVVVASRRNVAPHGMMGGEDGAPGRQWVERADGSVEPIPGYSGSAELAAGDALVVETPGGGGWGKATEGTGRRPA
jgi:5-oxoprolinase (ATP-hydrolysing)